MPESHRVRFQTRLRLYSAVVMDSRPISHFFWIIMISKALLCLSAPFEQPDPFQGLDHHQELKDERVFQMEVLEKLGIQEPYIPPSITKEDLVIPDQIYAKYNSLLEHHRVKRKTITQGVHENPVILGTVVTATASRHVYSFNMSSIPGGSEIMMAELRVFKELPNQSTHKQNSTRRHQVMGALVSIHQVGPRLEDQEDGENAGDDELGTPSGNTTVKVDERVIGVDTFGWKNFDVTEAVRRWAEDSSAVTTLGLELRVAPAGTGSYARRIAGRVHFSPEEEPDDEEKGVPVLVVYTVKYAPVDDPVDCSADGSDADRCCRTPKYVDFRHTSWANRWIIEPAGFEAYGCTGPCHRRTAHRHRTLRDVFGLRPGAYRTCGVARFSSLPMMYLIERDGVSELEVEEIPNMIVEDCECTA